jgi:hypothetical protein
MARTNKNKRQELISKIEQLRKSKVVCFLTTLRPNVPGQIADDQVRVIFDHLLQIKERPIPRLDLFLVSNGGNSVIPWRLVSLFREFAKQFCVLVPYRAYSAATLIALGADEIVMHPFGELGPIDPSVSNDFNPRTAQGVPIPISVEDVTSYVSFIKKTVGITHEDELVKTIEALCSQVHPLALGNVERFVSQSRMVATKVLKTHMLKEPDHTIQEMVENMTSKLYFHGHPINRQEALNDLKLKICENPGAELEKAIWGLYLQFEEEFKNNVIFLPAADLFRQFDPAAPQLITVENDLLHGVIESSGLRSEFRSTRRHLLMPTPAGPQLMEQPLSQGWTHSKQ